MFRLALYALPLAVLALGCGDKDDDDDEEDSGEADSDGSTGGWGDGSDGGDGGSDGADGGDGAGDGGDGTDAFAITEGHWVITGGDLVYDNCQADGDDLPAGEDEGFTVAMTGATSFTWTFDGTGDTANCTLSGERDFVCETMHGAEDVDDVDVTITSQVGIAGSYASPVTTASIWTVVLDCDGGDCWLAEAASDVDFPCDFQITVNAAADN